MVCQYKNKFNVSPNGFIRIVTNKIERRGRYLIQVGSEGVRSQKMGKEGVKRHNNELQKFTGGYCFLFEFAFERFCMMFYSKKVQCL